MLVIHILIYSVENEVSYKLIYPVGLCRYSFDCSPLILSITQVPIHLYI